MGRKGDTVQQPPTPVERDAVRELDDAELIHEGADRYELGGLLGRGGMGEVREVFDHRLRRDVAVKTLSRATPDRALAIRFVQEAQVTGQLQHPNIVPVHDLYRTPDGRLRFTMKRVRGRSLEQRIEAGESGSLVERLDIFRKVCDAIALAHSRGVIHRDLKPANVMVGEFGEVLVLDWGVAKVLDHGTDIDSIPVRTEQTDLGSDVTRADAVIGTPAYMSPESAAGTPEKLDRRSDIYALGALLYALLTESAPFEGDVHQILYAVGTGELQAPRVRAPERVPRELNAVVMKAMSLRPEERYPTVEALRADVQAYLEGQELSVVEYTALDRLRKWVAKRRRVVGAVGLTASLAVLALVLGGLVYLDRVTEARDQARVAERDASLRYADGQVALAAMTIEQGDTEAAREHLQAASETYAGLGASDLPASVVAAYLAHESPPALVTWVHDQAGVGRCALSPDDRRLVYSDGAGEVRTLAFPGLTPLPDVSPRTVTDLRMLVFPGGEPAALHGVGGGLQLTRLTDGVSLGTIPVVAEDIAGIWPSPDGNAALIFTRPDVIRAWSMLDLQPIGPEISTGGRVMGTSAGGLRFVGYEFEGHYTRAPDALSVWDSRTGERVATFGPTSKAGLSPNGRWLVRETPAGLEVTDVDGGEVLWHAPLPQIGHVRFTPDGQRVFAYTYGGMLTPYDARTGERGASRRTEVFAPIAMTAGGELAVSNAEDVLAVWSVAGSGPAWRREADDSSLTSLALSPDGVLLATGSMGGQIGIWEPQAGALLQAFEACPEGTRDLAFEGDGRHLWTANRDGGVRRWDLARGELVQTIVAEEGIAMALAIREGGAELLVGYESGAVVLWDVARGEELRRFQGPQEVIWDLALSRDGTRLVTSGRVDDDPVVVIWDLASGGTAMVSEEIQDAAYAVDVSPDGASFAVATHTGGAWTGGWWEPGSAMRQLALEKPALALAYAPAQPVLAVATVDGAVHLWDVEQGRLLLSMGLHEEMINDLLFTPDGVLLSVDADGVMTRFDLRLHQRLQEAAVVHEVGARVEVEEVELGLGRAAGLLGNWPLAASMLQQAPTEGAGASPLERARVLWAAGELERAREAIQAAREGGELLPGTAEVWLAAEPVTGE